MVTLLFIFMIASHPPTPYKASFLSLLMLPLALVVALIPERGLPTRLVPNGSQWLTDATTEF